MQRKLSYRYIKIFFIVLCVSLLSACAASAEMTPDGDNDKTTFAYESEEKDKLVSKVVYDMKKIEHELSISEESEVVSGGGAIYVCGKNKKGDVESLNYQCEYVVSYYNYLDASFHTIYSKKGNVDLWMGNGSGEHILQLATDMNGNAVMLICCIDNENNKEYQLIKIDKAGNVLWSSKIEGVTQMYSVVVCIGERTLAMENTGIFVFDNEGNLEKRINSEDRGSLRNLYPSQDGRVFVKYNTTSISSDWDMAVLDLDAETWTEVRDIFWEERYENILSGGASGFDFIIWDRLAISGWNVGDETLTELVNLIDSGIDGGTVDNLAVIKDGEMIVVSADNENGASLYQLSRSESLEDSAKEYISIGCFDSSEIVNEVIRFNQNSNKYQVQLIDYSIYGSDNQLTRLNLDITTGKMPDIILIDDYREMPLESYIRQGMLENLYDWIDQDSEMAQSDYLTNVFEAYSVDGCLYQMPTAFYISAYAAKTSIVGENSGWTLGEVLALKEKYPESSVFEGWIVRNTILREILQYGIFVDEVNKTCNFDSEEFIEMLNWLNQIPAKEDYEKLWPLNRENKVLISKVTLNSFEMFQWVKERTFGEDVTYLNFSGEDGKGGYIQDGEIRLAMSANSQCKEGAWQFIRYFLSDEYQKKVCTTNNPLFPVKISVLDWLAERTLEADEEPDVYYINGIEMTVPAMTQKDVDEAIRYIKMVNQTGSLNYDIYNIVKEETAFFFSGQKIAEDVAKIIQGRVGIYLAEAQ